MFCEDENAESCSETEALAVAERPVDHILIIDDDRDQTTALSHRFTKQGYRVTVAHTCKDGTHAALADHPDLILLDIALPDGDGLKTCATFSDGEETSGIPVIIVSGAEKYDVVRQARAAGCHYFVRKPYDPSALLTLSVNAIAESRDW